MKRIVVFLLGILPLALCAQNNTIGDFTRDESVFYAQTKQVNQFFRRFNGEEDATGKRYYSKDAQFRDPKARKKYLNILFDKSNGGISSSDKNSFINQVVTKPGASFLDFHGKSWYAEVSCNFSYKKEKVNLILFLQIEKQDSGYKWVFSNVFFDKFNSFFSHLNDTSNTTYFLHPLSHELDFMNLNKVFRDPNDVDYYVERNYEPDQMSIFIMEVKSGNLKFESVNDVKFHFFQVPGWYFEVSYFNRNDYNSGWLISNLLKVSDKDKNILIRHYTHAK
ncbi:MAG: hypothetical protein Q8867_02160 [Bacteroidota bacterium]|nr:hypothetical protein [Bacteroidota bacterium]